MDSKVWFQDEEESYKVIEESMFQSNLNRVFTLLRIADYEDILDLEWDF